MLNLCGMPWCRGLVMGVIANLVWIAPSPAVSASQVTQVIVVFKTHFDIGYTDMASNVVQRYRTEMIDNALKCVEESRSLPPEQQFVWTIPGWPMHKILEDWPGQTPERKEKIYRAVKEGRFVMHALPFSTHTELLEPEDLVRGLGYSSRLSRELGLPLPRDAKMTDVPCHSWFIPTLLKNAGVDFLHLGCNAGSRSPAVPLLFWWEGPDGSRLLTMYSAAGYGTGLVPPADWPHKTWLALIQTGDNHGPPRPEEVRQLLDQARQKLPGVKLRIGRMSDFADALLAEKPNLPVVRADMPDSWIHGPMCDPLGAKTARQVRPAIATAESLGTELGIWGAKLTIHGPGRDSALPLPAEAERATDGYVESIVAHAYEQSLLYGEHTWGGALGWAVRYSAKTEFPYGEAWKKDRAAGRFQRLEDSWAEHSSYSASAAALIQPLLAGELGDLAGAVNAKGQRIVVYNPLPWKRDGLVTVTVPQLALEALKPADGKGVIPVEKKGNMIRFLARDVPASGYRTFVPADSSGSKTDLKANPADKALENRFFRVAVNPANGSVQSLVDKRTGRELVDATAGHGFGQFLYERYDADQVAAYVKAYVKITADWALTELGKPGLPPASQVPYRAATPRNCSLRFETNGMAVSAVMESPATEGLPCPITTRVVLYAGQPCLDIEITLQDKPADPWPEAGWICLPAKADQPQFRLVRQASIMDPAKDIEPGANRFMFGVDGGASVTDSKGVGVGFCPLDSPLVSFDRPGCWQYAMDFTPTKPVAYVNLFNNQWSTNFRLWNQGSWTSRVRVWPLRGGNTEAALATPSLESRYPLQAGWAQGTAGPLPPARAGVELSRKGIALTAFGPNPDGPGTILRLWDYAGQNGKCTVRLPQRLKCDSVQPVDLRGRPIGPALKVRQGTFSAALKPFAPLSFQLHVN